MTDTLPAAVILAGSRPGGDPFATAQGAGHKALIEVGGEAMLARVIAALNQAAVPARNGLAALDVDKASDLAEVRRIVEG